MFIDVGRQCATAAFSFGAAATMRQYNIKVFQYECGNEMAGPPGCLQFFTGQTGVVASFNYPINQATLATTGTGADNRKQNILMLIFFHKMNAIV